jgi:integrase
MLAYLQYAQVRYVRNGRPTRELETMKYAFRPLRALYGHSAAANFGPCALKTIQGAMIQSQLRHRVINQRIGYIKRLFKWGSEQELIAPVIYHGLICVRGLSYGEMGVRNSEPVKPVPEEHVRAILPFLPPTLKAMVELQWLTGMRSGEMVAMTGIEITSSGEVWCYRQTEHKTARFGRDKVIPLGPRCQKLIRPFLRLNPRESIFSPKGAQSERMLEKRKRRLTDVPAFSIRSKEAQTEALAGRALQQSFLSRSATIRDGSGLACRSAQESRLLAPASIATQRGTTSPAQSWVRSCAGRPRSLQTRYDRNVCRHR